MPIYVYECRSCRRRFEKLQSYNDEPIRVCPHCGGETHRVFQPVGVIFKGSGWYITDNRKSDSSAVTSRGERRADGAAESSESTTPSAPSTPTPPAAPGPPAASGGTDSST